MFRDLNLHLAQLPNPMFKPQENTYFFYFIKLDEV